MFNGSENRIIASYLYELFEAFTPVEMVTKHKTINATENYVFAYTFVLSIQLDGFWGK